MNGPATGGYNEVRILKMEIGSVTRLASMAMVASSLSVPSMARLSRFCNSTEATGENVVNQSREMNLPSSVPLSASPDLEISLQSELPMIPESDRVRLQAWPEFISGIVAVGSSKDRTCTAPDLSIILAKVSLSVAPVKFWPLVRLDLDGAMFHHLFWSMTGTARQGAGSSGAI